MKRISLDAAMATLSGVVALGGLASILHAWSAVGGDLHATKKMLAELGVLLPTATEVAIAIRIDVVSVYAALGLAPIPFALAKLAPGRRALVWAGALAALALQLLVLLVCVWCDLGLAAVYVQAVQRTVGERPAPIPGRAAEIAEQVAAAFERDLREHRSRFSLPGNSIERKWVLFTGPGTPRIAPPSSYDAAVPGGNLVLLPWGPDGNTMPDKEPMLYFPPPPRADLSSSALARSGPPDLFQLVEGPWGNQVERIERVFALEDGYSYAISLRRAKADTVHDPPRFGASQIDGHDAFVDDLLELRVHVFRGFDESRARSAPLPEVCTPAATFVTLVRR